MVDTHEDVPMWRSLIAVHVYISVILVCHFRCAFAHALLCALHVMFIIFFCAVLVIELDVTLPALYTLTIVLATLGSTALHPLISWPFFYFRVNPDEINAALERRAEGIRLLRRTMTTDPMKDYVRGSSGGQVGVSGAALDALDHIEFDADGFDPQSDDETMGKAIHIDRDDYSFGTGWRPDEATDPDHDLNIQFNDEGEHTGSGKDEKEDAEDFAFVGLWRPGQRTPPQKVIALPPPSQQQRKAPDSNPTTPTIEDLDHDRNERNVLFMYGHLAQYDNSLFEKEATPEGTPRQRNIIYKRKKNLHPELDRSLEDENNYMAPPEKPSKTGSRASHRSDIQATFRDMYHKKSTAATKSKDDELNEPLEEEDPEEERPTTSTGSYTDAILIETFYGTAVTAGIVLLCALIIGLWFVFYEMDRRKLCFDFPRMVVIAFFVDVLVVQQVFLGIVYFYRLLTSDEYDTIWSELHPYDEEPRTFV